MSKDSISRYSIKANLQLGRSNGDSKITMYYGWDDFYKRSVTASSPIRKDVESILRPLMVSRIDDYYVVLNIMTLIHALDLRSIDKQTTFNALHIKLRGEYSCD